MTAISRILVCWILLFTVAVSGSFTSEAFRLFGTGANFNLRICLFNIPGVMAWPDISLGVAPAKPVHVCARDPVLTVLT